MKKTILLTMMILGLFQMGTAQINSGGNPVFSEKIYFAGNTGDKISLFSNRLNGSNMYGFGVGNYTTYYKSYGNHAWLQGKNVENSDDQHDIFRKSAMHLSHNGSDGTILSLVEMDDYQDVNSGEIRMLEKGAGSYLYGGFMKYNGNTNQLQLGGYTGASKYVRMVIHPSSGNVGIGTTSPDYSLDVAGPANLNKNTSGTALRVDGDAAIWYNGTYFNWGAGGSYNYFSDRVGIGTNDPHPDYMLSVNGKIRAKEIRVESGWADFVFEPDYVLPSLDSVETFIHENGHLPGIPSAKTIQEEGLDLGELEKRMMQKIEELTLYVIDLKKENESLKALIESK